ncbi:alanine racemase [Georhizobium profundi]|uniref:Alanine racemase n=2 Tax=Georhizobium profundi TaxID=2341112 RepID=A0A3Q8XRZ1_9HYPH|nr:alanine racemase [Georhizobium profundi]
MAARSRPARASAVVKANGYGLGIEPVVRTLSEAGCRDFFTATIDEAITARRLAPHAHILVLNGIYPGTEQCFRKHRLTPILCSMEQVQLWDEACTRDGRLPYALHVDTGMNRLGVTMPEALAAAEREDTDRPALIMSHLACADDPDRPENARQLESFQAVRRAFQSIESSLSNSAGIILGGAYLCDLTRPGIALYGGEAVNRAENPMQVVATAKARILQIRRAPAGSTVSYGATVRLPRDTKIAVCAVGYADGYLRSLSGSGIPLRDTDAPAPVASLHGQAIPVLGRVTMDLTMFDVTDVVGQKVRCGDFVELFGKSHRLDDLARSAGTIGYEILTSLGSRYARHYQSSSL